MIFFYFELNSKQNRQLIFCPKFLTIWSPSPLQRVRQTWQFLAGAPERIRRAESPSIDKKVYCFVQSGGSLATLGACLVFASRLASPIRFESSERYL